MIPGMGNLSNVEIDDKELVRIEAMICSMTLEERQNPKILNASRRIRIASGSGTTVQQLNKFMKTFEITQKMMKEMKSPKGMRNMMRKMNINPNAIDMSDLDNLK